MGDVLLDRDRAAAPPVSFDWREALHVGLTLLFFAYVLIGTQPLADPSVAQRVDGSPLDRIAVLGLLALALAALAAHWRQALAMIPRNIGLVVLVGFCLASVMWSDHPDLTIRRALLLAMLAVVAAGVAASVTDLRRFHTLLFASLAAVAVLNLAATAALPGRAVTDLGVRGIYSQKNVAGLVSMIGAVAGLTWVFGARSLRAVALGLAGLAPILLLLLVSRSKTSIALTALAFALVLGIALAERLGPRFVALAAGCATTLAAFGLAGFAVAGFDPGRAIELFTGDASFTGRDELWAFALDRAQERPWLGHGYGAFWDVGPGADPLLRVDPGSWLGDIAIGTINQAHNGYLELWLQIGLPATALAVLVVTLRLGLAARNFFCSVAARPERCAIGMLGLVLLLHLLHNLTEATLFMRGIAFFNVAMLTMLLVTRTSASALRKHTPCD